MQFIQRARWPVLTRDTRIRRMRAAVRLVMRHIGLAGRCDCVLTRDERGREGVWLRIETPQCVPPAERAQFQAYFRRKLFELGELGERGQWDLQLQLCDGNDLASAGGPAPGHVSSRRIASILRGANRDAVASHGMRVTQLREHLSARRRERIDSDFTPLQNAQLTDLGALGEV